MIKANDKMVKDEVVVVKSSGKPLFGRITATQLGILRIGAVEAVDHDSKKENIRVSTCHTRDWKTRQSS